MARLDWRSRFALEHWAKNHIHSAKVELPEDWPASHRLSSTQLDPLFCGDHAPGLSGVYAVVNGLKLLLADVAPLQPADERLLLELGWRFMSGRGYLAPHIGIRQQIFIRMADALSFALARRRRAWVRCEVLFGAEPREDIRDFLERLIVAQHAVLILLGHGHYTVLRGYTPASWLLFDATGRQWMLRRAMGQSRVFKPILSLSHGS